MIGIQAVPSALACPLLYNSFVDPGGGTRISLSGVSACMGVILLKG